MKIFRFPDLGLQVMLENLEVDLAGAGQLLIINLFRQLLEGLAGKGNPVAAGGRRNIVEQMVEPVIAKTRGFGGLLLEARFQVGFEKGVQFIILRGLGQEG
jgi:hypothetical protein